MTRSSWQHPRRFAAVFLFGLMGLSVVGFLIGIDMGSPSGLKQATLPQENDHPVPVVSVSPAMTYSEMRRMDTGPTSQAKPVLQRIDTVYNYERCTTCHDPHSAAITTNQQAKLDSLKARAERRAFNGAPPQVPHAVEHTDDAACYACHGQGARIGEGVANPMSHRFMVHCLQCHAGPTPLVFQDVQVSVENSFAGLKAPTEGERAGPGAPPVIPHSTWMREQCLSCHGGIGWEGLEVTHRWRTNCLQCHAITSPLDQPDAHLAIKYTL